jgi:hypothetical protein
MDKITLSKKSVLALERLAKKVGAKTVTPEGKKKNKTQLVNSIVIASRLGKKNPALKTKKAPARKTLAEKPKTTKTNLDALKIKAYNIGYKTGIANKVLRPGGSPEVLALIKNLPTVEATAIFKAHNKGWVEARLEQGRTALANYLKKKK